jgi:Carboxypeptidase regulatory-like domain
MNRPNKWKSILSNRFVLVPGILAVAVLVWNIYVATHSHGVVIGRVVDTNGNPVADATVALWTYNFTTYEEKEHVWTDARGNFRFSNNSSHKLQISAEKPGVGRSDRIPVFLYFRSQDIDLSSPLRLDSN